MPIFDFVCTKCENKFEELLSQNSTDNPPCPKCGAATTRQMSSPSPLKTGAFPYKIGPVQPLGRGKPSSCQGTCGH